MQAVYRMEAIFHFCENKFTLEKPGICGGEISILFSLYNILKKCETT